MAALTAAQHEIRRSRSKGSTPRENAGGYAAVGNGNADEPKPEPGGMIGVLADKPFLTFLLIFIPIGFWAAHSGQPDMVIFTTNFCAVIPLAWLIGKATEDLAAVTGDVLGGLLNATFGNVVEMLLCIAGVRSGQLIVTQCTLIGSILSNLLLVMGCAFFLGGCFYKVQVYSQAGASVQCSLLLLSTLAMGLPTGYGYLMQKEDGHDDDTVLLVSRNVSVLMLFMYAGFLYFQLRTHVFLFQAEGEEEEEVVDLSPVVATILLATATVVTSATTDQLILSIEGTVEAWGLSQEFIGIILLPIIGNAAEHYTAITTAVYNKMDLSLGVAVGSSCQMALLVTPFTVVMGWIFDQPMSLDFHPFQSFMLFFAVIICTSVLSNGQTNWLEGLMLLMAYVIVATIYFCESPAVSVFAERPNALVDAAKKAQAATPPPAAAPAASPASKLLRLL
jgi:Ca2+:H+ antiporter